MRAQLWISIAVALLAADIGALQAQASDTLRICLIPPAVEGGNNTAADAVKASFTSLLTGPSLTSQALQAPLASQARLEAKQAGCPFILFTTLKVVSKSSGGGMLGRVAGSVARQGVAEVGLPGGSVAGRIASSAANEAVQQATSNFAGTIRNRDELTLGYRLEAADGKVLVDKKEKRSAKSDGEDVLTPLAREASERIVEAAAQRKP